MREQVQPFFYFTANSHSIYIPNEFLDKADKMLDNITPHLKDTGRARHWLFENEEQFRIAASRLVGRGFHVQELSRENSNKVLVGELSVVARVALRRVAHVSG